MEREGLRMLRNIDRNSLLINKSDVACHEALKMTSCMSTYIPDGSITDDMKKLGGTVLSR